MKINMKIKRKINMKLEYEFIKNSANQLSSIAWFKLIPVLDNT